MLEEANWKQCCEGCQGACQMFLPLEVRYKMLDCYCNTEFNVSLPEYAKSHGMTVTQMRNQLIQHVNRTQSQRLKFCVSGIAKKMQKKTKKTENGAKQLQKNSDSSGTKRNDKTQNNPPSQSRVSESSFQTYYPSSFKRGDTLENLDAYKN